MILSQKTKPMSSHLMGLIRKAVTSLVSLGKLWEEIKQLGQQEGFTDKQLMKKIREQLREKLGLNKFQVYYFFHKEQKKEANKKAYESRINPTSDAGDGNDIASSDGIKFDPKHFNPKNILYYDVAYLRQAALYFYERQKK